MVSLDRGIRYSILTLVMHGELVVQMGFHRGAVVVGFVVRLQVEGPSLNSSTVILSLAPKNSAGEEHVHNSLLFYSIKRSVGMMALKNK